MRAQTLVIPSQERERCRHCSYPFCETKRTSSLELRRNRLTADARGAVAASVKERDKSAPARYSLRGPDPSPALCSSCFSFDAVAFSPRPLRLVRSAPGPLGTPLPVMSLTPIILLSPSGPLTRSQKTKNRGKRSGWDSNSRFHSCRRVNRSTRWRIGQRWPRSMDAAPAPAARKDVHRCLHSGGGPTRAARKSRKVALSRI